jgi:hypothetical protein
MRRSEPFRKPDLRRTGMAMELAESTTNGYGSDKETLYMMGGVAMVVFGAGLILSSPAIRRYLPNLGVGNLAQAILPDLARYLKIRGM